ncbi:MAG: putative 7-carboxy-7-deazaguanine synthase QueE [Clostridia bacterium]|nr:putative 7-carboxy-7-deazaguanine synthase QueE [Clostridia bacterium]
MLRYKVVEKFISINGEGRLAGELAVFIRFQGCNLACSYCDTTWANQEEAPYELMTAEELYSYIKETKVCNITLTGGEPLLNPKMDVLLRLLGEDQSLNIEIETNGSVDLAPFAKLERPPVFTMDYKLPSSLMEADMMISNFDVLGTKDTVKFVVGDFRDLERAREIIRGHQLISKCQVYLSTVFGKISLDEVVTYMKTHKMNGVRLQLQMHKVIWDPNLRGV